MSYGYPGRFVGSGRDRDLLLFSNGRGCENDGKIVVHLRFIGSKSVSMIIF